MKLVTILIYNVLAVGALVAMTAYCNTGDAAHTAFYGTLCLVFLVNSARLEQK